MPGTTSTGEYLRRIGVARLGPRTSPFDPGLDPATVASHLDQSAHLISVLKVSMAGWLVANEASTRARVAAARALRRRRMDALPAMYLDLTGQPAGPQQAPVAGRRFLVEPPDAQATLGSNRRRPTSAREWARSLRGVDETAWWSAADPLPALAIAATLARRSLRSRDR